MSKTQKIRFISFPVCSNEILTYRVVYGTDRLELGLVSQRKTNFCGVRWFAWDRSDQPVGPVAVGHPTRKVAAEALRGRYFPNG